ncbi:unnamed protein product [Alternaria alternata]
MSKIGVLSLFALGFLASFATIIRLVYFASNTSTKDYLNNAATLGMWTFVELGIGIVGSSIATFKPPVSQVTVQQLFVTSRTTK